MPRGASTTPMPTLGLALGMTRMFGAGNLRVVDQLDDALGGVNHFDHARPMVGEGVMHRLAAERVEELLVGLLSLRCGHAVSGVEARQRGDGVDAALRSFLEPVPAEGFEDSRT